MTGLPQWQQESSSCIQGKTSDLIEVHLMVERLFMSSKHMYNSYVLTGHTHTKLEFLLSLSMYAQQQQFLQMF